MYLLLLGVATKYTFSIRRTPACWDTFLQLIALAYQSQPARSELRNTYTGINKLETARHKSESNPARACIRGMGGAGMCGRGNEIWRNRRGG